MPEIHQKVNLKKISELTGFSTATISNALNRKRGVNKDTAATIFRVAKELGYVNEDRITTIRLVVFRKNGEIIDDTPFSALMMDGIEKECREQGLEMLLNRLSMQDDNYLEQVRWTFDDASSAVIVLGTELLDEDVDLLKSSNCHIVTLDFWSKDMMYNGITINNTDSARVAVNYLISKGHSRIGYLRGKFRIKAFHERAIGYHRAMRNAGKTILEQDTITLPTKTEDAYRSMLAYLNTKPNLPTAFFADNDMIALGAMRALQEKGVRIPEDVSVIGFDDLPFSELANPPLTTMRVPKREMGRLAVKRMLEIIVQGNAIKTQTQVCASIMERSSVCNVSINDERNKSNE